MSYKEFIRSRPELIQALEGYAMSKQNQNSSSAPDDQLNGWIPVWKQKPDNDRDVKLLIFSDGIFIEYKGQLLDGLWSGYYKIVSPECEDIIRRDDKVLAWKELESYPDLELFFEPSPPKHQLFDLRFVPFSSFKPWKTGEYVLYDEKTNTYKTFKIYRSNPYWEIIYHDRYTHWALVREEK